MTDYRFRLEPYRTMKDKYRCPECSKKTFTRYVDNETNEHIGDKVGKCSRLIKCNYHFTPKQYFTNNNISFKPSEYNRKTSKTKTKKEKPSSISIEELNKSILSKQTNFFIDYLATVWNYDVANELALKYNIGVSNYWNGSTVFWQVDANNNIRSGKIMLYNASNGKRVKKPYNHINWMHNVLKLANYNLEQCLFGEHLLKEDKEKPIAIVESEKTAIISSVYLPEFIWLACGSANNLNKEKTKVLRGRNVVLFPDLGCYDLWNDKIPKLNKLATYRTSTLLERKATNQEKQQGLDIADYLVQIV